MTEEEAKTKWCPHMRIAPLVKTDDGFGVQSDITAFNMSAPPKGGGVRIRAANCIASECSQWRWDRNAKIARMRNGNGSEFLVHPNRASMVIGTFVGMDPAQGYCGLAGDPDNYRGE